MHSYMPVYIQAYACVSTCIHTNTHVYPYACMNCIHICMHAYISGYLHILVILHIDLALIEFSTIFMVCLTSTIFFWLRPFNVTVSR